VEAIRQAGVHEKINSLPNGLHTHILSGGKGLSSSMVHRLILARCFAKKPGLIILNDFFSGLTKSDKLDLIQRIVDKSQHWTVITESNDPAIMSACDRVIIVHDGKIEAQGRFEDLIHDVNMKQYLE
jgi:ABC-type multidrug transport system fused ATPase/permease subunit